MLGRERRFFEEAAELRTMLDGMLRKCGCVVTEEVLQVLLERGTQGLCQILRRQ